MKDFLKEFAEARLDAVSATPQMSQAERLKKSRSLRKRGAKLTSEARLLEDAYACQAMRDAGYEIGDTVKAQLGKKIVTGVISFAWMWGYSYPSVTLEYPAGVWHKGMRRAAFLVGSLRGKVEAEAENA